MPLSRYGVLKGRITRQLAGQGNAPQRLPMGFTELEPRPECTQCAPAQPVRRTRPAVADNPGGTVA